MTEKHQASVRREPNEEDVRQLLSHRDIDALETYTQERLKEVLKRDPKGYLAKSLEFQGGTSNCIRFQLAEPHNPTDPEYSIELHRNHHRISCMEIGIVPQGEAFRNIGRTVENAIIDLPQNAVQFMGKYTKGLPAVVQAVPSIRRVGTVIDDNPNFFRTWYSYTLWDYRDHDLEHCISVAQDIQQKLTLMTAKGNAIKFAVSNHIHNDWTLFFHKYNWDYSGWFSKLINAHIDIPGVRVVGTQGIPDDYEQDDNDDFIAPFGKYTNSFPPSLIEELRSRLEMLREDYESILLHVRNLFAASGGPADGAVVEIYKKPTDH